MKNDEELKELLEWYITAGVDETVGDLPFALNLQHETKSGFPLHFTSAKAKSSATSARPATTALAQAAVDACHNARDLCKTVSNLDELRQIVNDFEGCALKLTASHTVFGGGNPQAKIILIGEAPGADEDRIGEPFVGRSGHLLDKMLSAVNLDRNTCYITNILPWRPPGNRTPTDAEIAVCLPFLKRQIDLINPDYLFIMGGSAANALLEQQESISHLRGHWLEYKTSEGKTIKALASYHPAYLLRNPGQKSKVWSDLLRLQRQMLADA